MATLWNCEARIKRIQQELFHTTVQDELAKVLSCQRAQLKTVSMSLSLYWHNFNPLSWENYLPAKKMTLTQSHVQKWSLTKIVLIRIHGESSTPYALLRCTDHCICCIDGWLTTVWAAVHFICLFTGRICERNTAPKPSSFDFTFGCNAALL